MTTETGALGRLAASREVPRQRAAEATIVTIALLVLVAWLPLQTPLAVALHQYAGVSAAAARGLLLLKDVGVAALIVVLALRHWREVRLGWYDACAAVYVALLGIYAIVPWLLGPALPVSAVVASVREFVVPVELYLLGRLAVAAGARPDTIARGLVVVAVPAAAFAVATWLLVPMTFWQSSLDLVRFVREVQGVDHASSLQTISIVASYGQQQELFVRAVGPFTHPVGAGHYFAVPLLLAVALGFRRLSAGEQRAALAYAAAAVLFGIVVIATISRGAWLAAGVGVLLIGWWMARLRLTIAALAVAGTFVLLVPPFSYSLRSAASGTDSSTQAHQVEVQRGVNAVFDYPLGLGVGQADFFGKVYGEQDDGSGPAGISENTYLSMFITVGPFGLLAFLLWAGGAGRRLVTGARSPTGGWLAVALVAGLLGFALSSLTASTMLRFTTAASFWLLVGLVAGARDWGRSANAEA